MVRYHNAGTQRFKDTEHESVDTDEVNLGDGDRIYFGDNDEWHIQYESSLNRWQIVWSDGPNAMLIFNDGPAGAELRNADLDFSGNNQKNVNTQHLTPQDVRNISSPAQGWTAYHDGSGTNTEGPAHYNGTDWISTVDGSTIA